METEFQIFKNFKVSDELFSQTDFCYFGQGFPRWKTANTQYYYKGSSKPHGAYKDVDFQ